MKAELMALFLEAVALVESGNNPRAVGLAGERGRFQMSPAVVATSGGYSQREALRHARWLERQLMAAGADLLVFNLALAWNAGATGALTGQAPESSYDYARRVEQTYLALLRERSHR